MEAWSRRAACPSIRSTAAGTPARAARRAGTSRPSHLSHGQSRFASAAQAAGLRPRDGDTVLGKGPDGACVFFERSGAGSCRVHAALGERALPSVCRHFPRVVVSDPRGTHISLSHFCPTAAALLFAGGALSIVDAPATLSLDGTAEGLDATSTLPPLLRTGMLTDYEGYAAWETAAITALDTAGAGVDDALRIVDGCTRAMAAWSPGGETLAECVARIFSTGAGCSGADEGTTNSDEARALLLSSVPAGIDVPAILSAPAPSADPGDAWRTFDRPIRRYLASRLFGAWWPHFGLTLPETVTAVRTIATVLQDQVARELPRCESPRHAVLEAIRDTDLLAVHLSDPAALARLLRQHP